VFAVRSLSVLVVSAVLVVHGAAAAGRQGPDDGTIAALSRKLVQSYADTNFFNGAALVARRGTVLYAGGAGPANVEHPAAITAETTFRIGGISQMFTAAAVLRLQEQGKLYVTDTVGKLVPTWPVEYHAITVHQLLTGTSGVKDVTQIPEFVRSVALPRETAEVAAIILKEKPVAAPGTWARAANSNYHLLAAIVERAAGLSFTEYVKREIITRAGLAHTHHDDPALVIPGRASGYTQSPEGLRHAAAFHMGNAVGSANLVSTVGDVHRFVMALLDGRVISQASLQQMLTAHVPPQKLAGGATTPGVGYGVNVFESDTSSSFVQGGSIGGFQANLNHDRRTGITIVVLSNIGNTSGQFAVTNGLLAITAGRDVHFPTKYTAVTPRPEDLAAIAGEWEHPTSFSILADGTRRPTTYAFRIEGGRLFGRGAGGAENEWYSSGPGQFFAKHLDIQIGVNPQTRDVATIVTSGRKGELRRLK
jgi:CubicO group peptidase (beta-lactamase class C family)